MRLLLRGFFYGLIFASVKGVGLSNDGVYTRSSYTWQFMVCKHRKRRFGNDKPE